MEDGIWYYSEKETHFNICFEKKKILVNFTIIIAPNC